MNRGDKLYGLEALRFLAAMAVLLYHYHLLAAVGSRLHDFQPAALPFYPRLSLLYDFGNYGVQVFWTISGYIFFWKYRESVANGTVDGPSFFVLRFSRLYPLHLVTLLFVACVQRVYFSLAGDYFVYDNNGGVQFVSQLFMASDWGIVSGSSFNGPIWSVSVEVLVYLLFFALLRWLGTSALVSVLVLAACAVALALKVSSFVVQCALFFYLGGLVATVQPRLARHRRGVTVASVALLASIGVTSLTLGRLPFHFKPSAVLLVTMPALLLLLTWHFRPPTACKRFIDAAGNMSYATYLLHFPIQLGIATACVKLGQAIPYRSPAFFFVFLGAVLVAARCSYVWFEVPCQRWLREKLMPKRVLRRVLA